jgi:hypothetical protein
MADGRQWKYYLYPWPQFFRIFSALGVLLGLFLLVGTFGMGLSALGTGHEGAFAAISLGLLVSLGVIWGGFVWGNSLPNIRISEDGLAVHYLFRWRFVPWTKFVEIATAPIGSRRPGSAGRIVRLVRVRKLSFYHQILGLSLSLTWRQGTSVFLIGSNIRGFDELMRTIRQNTGANDGFVHVG